MRLAPSQHLHVPFLVLAHTILITLAGAAPAAAWTPNGVPLCLAPGGQYTFSAVPDLSGGAIVIFYGGQVFAQHVAADGSIAPGFGPNGNPVSHSTGNASVPRSAPDGAGGAFVVWEDSRSDPYDIYGQHLLASGAIDPAWPASDLPIGAGSLSQDQPAVAPDGSGGLLVVWQDDRNGPVNTYAQRVSAAGAPLWTPNGVGVCLEAGVQFHPRVIGDGLGGAYVTWEDNRTGRSRIYAQHLAADGTLVAGWPVDGLPVGNPGAVGVAYEPELVSDGAGGVIIGWTTSPQGAVFHTIALRLLADGSVAPGWPPSGTLLCNLLQTQDLPAIVTDRAGGAIVVWHDFRDIQNPLATYDLYAQRVSAAGVPMWSTNGVPVCTAPGSPDAPSAVSDDEGGIIITWPDPRGADMDIYALRLLADGNRAPGWITDGNPICSLSGDQTSPVIVPDGLSGAIIAWTDARPGPRTQIPDIYAAKTIDEVVVPVVVSLVSAAAEPGRVRLAWLLPGAAIPARVWRRDGNAPWSVIASVSSSGDGSVRFDDRDVVAGATYGYRLGLPGDSGERFGGETSIAVPAGAEFTLEGARPNPALDGLTVAFSLPDAAPAQLEVIDTSGRQIVARAVEGAGRQVMRIAEPGAIAPGIYLVRLTRHGGALTARVAVVR